MSQDAGQGRHPKHSHNLSINSASSLSEPTTPPTSQYASRNTQIWDPAKTNGNLSLPSFNLDQGSVLPNHSRRFSCDSFSDKENMGPNTESLVERKLLGWRKVDKEYVASISKTPLSELKDVILKLAKDQHGCRFLQKRIDENLVPNAQTRLANFAVIFEQIEDNLYELIIDPFGNYLVQKLTDYCDEAILDKFMGSLSTNLFQISINQHGTRALQKIIDKMSNDYQLSLLVRGLINYIIELIKDLNGNHVIQKILNKYSPENCQFIYDAITRDLLVVATHKHGCCVLQKCLNHVNEKQRAEFSNVILKYSNFERLVNDQFGNYVLQYLVSINSIDVNVKLFENLTKYGIQGLCTLKFSSNVIEKLLKNCFTNEYRLKSKIDVIPDPEGVTFSNLKFTMIYYILTSDLNKIVNDPYGNYVMQTLIDILIHPKGVYFSESPAGERIMLPSLRNLLGENFQSSIDTLQVQIIKKWLNNCEITSPFGKRIQMKMNLILSGTSKPYSKASNKDAWRNSTNMSQKHRFTPQQKQLGMRNQAYGNYADYPKVDQRYEFRDLNRSMRNMNIDNAVMKPRSFNLQSDSYSQMLHSHQGKKYENESFNLAQYQGQPFLRNESGNHFQVNEAKQIQGNLKNFAPINHRETNKDAFYSGQHYPSMTSSFIDQLPQSGLSNAPYQYRQTPQNYSSLVHNQALGCKETGPQEMNVGINPRLYHATAYPNPTDQAPKTRFNAKASEVSVPDKRYYLSFG